MCRPAYDLPPRVCKITSMIGKRLGSWVIEKELGRGGMGRVYLAQRDPPTSPDGIEATEAAVKVLSAELAQDPGFLHRFQREIEALRQLDHPNIVRFYESGMQDGQHFYAMEYIVGKNFDQLLHDQKRLPWKDVLDMAMQACPAIKHAHDHGIIHRDLKPQNLMRTEEGKVKLADFGVAKVFASRQLTATGGLVGTAEYISPEQAAGKPVSVRSDLYSFGVVMYTLLTGRLPFQGTGVLDLLHKHRFAQFDPPQSFVPDMPHELDEIVCSLLEKDPEDRPANALVLQRQFESLGRKLERKEQHTVVSAQVEATRAEHGALIKDEGPGPATLMSQLVRAELEKQRHGGPLQRFLNHPAVLIALFALCVGLLAWGLWPLSAQTLFDRGSKLMDSDDPADWDRAWNEYFEPLQRKYPEHPYQEQVSEHRRRIDDRKAESRALKQSTTSSNIGDAANLYALGQRLRKEGDLLGAQRAWEDLVAIFAGVESESRWVELARKRLAELGQEPPLQERRAAVLEAIQQAAKLDRDAAEKRLQAIERRFGGDPAVLRELEKARAEIAKKN